MFKKWWNNLLIVKVFLGIAVTLYLVIIGIAFMGGFSSHKDEAKAKSIIKEIKHVTSTSTTVAPKEYSCDNSSCQSKNDVILKSGEDYTDYFVDEGGKAAVLTIFHHIKMGDNVCEIISGNHGIATVCH